MDLVVDANVLIAGFIRRATTRELLLDGRLSLWTPEYSLTEVERVLTAPRLRKKLGSLPTLTIRQLLGDLTQDVEILPARDYRRRLSEAMRLAPHTEDAPYLAVALHLQIPLWSNDLELKQQKAVKVYTTGELLEALRER